jgi:type 1 glutamine amidotransferase
MATKSIPRKVRFHVGGPSFHPVEDQARQIALWLGDGYECSYHQDKEIFDHLRDTDLLVLMGLFFSAEEGYQPLAPASESALEAYIASGRPLILHHGAAASYDDSETFKRLIGINWVWGGDQPTLHSPVGDYDIKVTVPSHPVTAGVGDYRLFDELYYDLRTQPSIRPEILAVADYKDQSLPMIQVFEGGRVDGAGKAVYFANGHDLKAFECPALRKLWTNAVAWLTSDNGK